MKAKHLGMLLSTVLWVAPLHLANAVTIDQGQTVLFNFSMFSASPAPNYYQIILSPDFSNYAGDEVTSTLFYDFNGLNPSGTFNTFFYALYSSYLVNDGSLSWSVTSVRGSFDVDPCVTGYSTSSLDGPQTACIAGEALSSVPEPGTVALLGLGLLGLGVSRRRA